MPLTRLSNFIFNTPPSADVKGVLAGLLALSKTHSKLCDMLDRSSV